MIPIIATIPPIYSEARMICRRSTGAYFPHTSLVYGIRKINYELGIPFNFHSLRHTHATMLIQGGVNIKAVQHRLGHSKISITLDIYGHVTSKMIENSVEIFESEILKIGVTN